MENLVIQAPVAPGYFNPADQLEQALMEISKSDKDVADIVQQIRNGRIFVQTKNLYSARPLSGTSLDFFKPSYEKDEGVTNVNNGRLDKSEFMLCNKIKLVSTHHATNAFTTDDAATSVKLVETWSEVDATNMGGLVNGELKVTVGNKVIIDNIHLSNFVGGEEEGVFYLPRPIFIKGGVEIKAELRLGAGVAANKALAVSILGVGTSNS